MEKRLKKLESIWGDYLPLATIMGIPQDYEGDESYPDAWQNIPLYSIFIDPETNIPRVACTRIRYIYNCNAYATTRSGARIVSFPIYHAAVEILAGEKIVFALMVRDTQLLKKLKCEFGMDLFTVRDPSNNQVRTFRDFWMGQQIEIELVDARQKPIPNKGIFANFKVWSFPYWTDEDMYQHSRRIVKAAEEKVRENTATLREIDPSMHGVFYNIVTNEDYVTVRHDTFVVEFGAQTLDLVQNDQVVDPDVLEEMLGNPAWINDF